MHKIDFFAHGPIPLVLLGRNMTSFSLREEKELSWQQHATTSSMHKRMPMTYVYGLSWLAFPAIPAPPDCHFARFHFLSTSEQIPSTYWPYIIKLLHMIAHMDWKQKIPIYSLCPESNAIPVL
jgi:hypothetical protein